MSAGRPRELPVYVVVPPRVLALDIAGPIEVLRKANALQRTVRFDLRYVGTSRTIVSSIGLTFAGIAPLPPRVPDGAIVVVPGWADAPAHETATDSGAQERAKRRIVDWLARTIVPGRTLVSICSGALLAGRAGLLDGYRCTTHFESCAELAALAPKATVLENRLYVEDRERFTSAGVTAGTDLMLHLVSRIVGAACAAEIARSFVIYLRRAGSDPQLSPWFEGRNHIHPVVHRVQDAISAEPARTWTLPALAAIAGASPRHLSRLFNEQAGMSVTDYCNRLRAALAHELVLQTQLDIERVAQRAGFASSRQLRRAWNRFYSTPPSQVRAQASRETA